MKTMLFIAAIFTTAGFIMPAGNHAWSGTGQSKTGIYSNDTIPKRDTSRRSDTLRKRGDTTRPRRDTLNTGLKTSAF